jgi:hypothetical protein
MYSSICKILNFYDNLQLVLCRIGVSAFIAIIVLEDHRDESIVS